MGSGKGVIFMSDLANNPDKNVDSYRYEKLLPSS